MYGKFWKRLQVTSPKGHWSKRSRVRRSEWSPVPNPNHNPISNPNPNQNPINLFLRVIIIFWLLLFVWRAVSIKVVKTVVYQNRLPIFENQLPLPLWRYCPRRVWLNTASTAFYRRVRGTARETALHALCHATNYWLSSGRRRSSNSRHWRPARMSALSRPSR